MIALTDISTFHSISWTFLTDVERPFVRYLNPLRDKAQICRVEAGSSPVILSVIIPTSDAERQGYFSALLEQIQAQNLPNFELIIVRGDTRQGRAVNIGAALARGRYLLTLDDDTSLPDRETFRKLLSVMEDHPDIGIAGGNNVIPDGCPPFIRRVMEEIPRRSWVPVREITDSDLAEHPCLIMRLDDFKAVGGENEWIPRGLDPYLRQEFRNLGKRVVLIPGVIYHHLPPGSWDKLLQQFYRNGRQAAFVNRHYPQWMIETPEQHGAFKAQRPFIFRVFRFPLRLLKAFLTGRFIFFFSEVAYATGFIYELLLTEHSPNDITPQGY
jgi:glycosyltransferase involved in cell wall biosynthesis